MIETLTTYNQSKELAVYGRTDPTRTVGLRRAFTAELNKRFRKLRGIIRKSIVEEDALGIAEPKVFMKSAGQKAFAFKRNAQKVGAFMKWLESQATEGIIGVVDLEQIGESKHAAWQNKHIYDSYEKGVLRANSEMRKAGHDIPKLTRAEVQNTLSQPYHADRLGVLYTRTYTELKGVTDDMAQKMTRVLSDGMAQGLGPNQVARNMNGVIKGGLPLEVKTRAGITRLITAEQRARMIARTEMIRAHHVATIQEYKTWEVEDVYVQAEWSTAGDHRVCEECEDIEGQVFTLEEAEGKIPLHPSCRCIMLPTKKDPKKPKLTKEEETLRGIEDEIRMNPKETAAIVDEEGNVLFRKEGTAKRVSIPGEKAELLKGNTLTHNHPGGGSFSEADIYVLRKRELKSMRAVSKDGLYTASLTDKGRKMGFASFKKKVKQTNMMHQVEISEKIRKGDYSVTRANAIHHDLLWKKVQKLGLINYKFEGR